MAPPNWPQVIVEGGFTPDHPVQPSGTFILDDPVNGKLDTATLGTSIVWSDITQWVRSGSVSRPTSRQQGPIYDYQVGMCSLVLNNKDGRFDPDNTGGPYQLAPMLPVRISAVWAGVLYRLFTGFADAWTDDGRNYAGHYAELTLTASDAQKVLNGITLPVTGAVGLSETTDARVTRILNAAGWYTGSAYRVIGTGQSTVQAYTGGDTAWALLKVTADSEAGELYINGSGQVVFRGRQQILTDTRSNTVQILLGDDPDIVDPASLEEPYTAAMHVLDDTTLANDVQVTRAGSSIMQEVKDTASITAYLFPRSYSRTDLILQDDPTALNWAQWVLYVSKTAENRLDSIAFAPQRDPNDMWPQALGREIGDRIQLNRRPPGVTPSPVTENCFIRGIQHDFDVSGGTWRTTWMLQDAAKYGSFLTLDNPILGRLNFNALAF